MRERRVPGGLQEGFFRLNNLLEVVKIALAFLFFDETGCIGVD